MGGMPIVTCGTERNPLGITGLAGVHTPSPTDTGNAFPCGHRHRHAPAQSPRVTLPPPPHQAPIVHSTSLPPSHAITLVLVRLRRPPYTPAWHGQAAAQRENVERPCEPLAFLPSLARFLFAVSRSLPLSSLRDCGTQCNPPPNNSARAWVSTVNESYTTTLRG